MRDWLRHLAVRIVTVMAVVIGILLVKSEAIAQSHNPLSLLVSEQLQHQALSFAPSEHGHAHDDGSDAEQQSGHLHGHNAGDHSHEVQHLPPVAVDGDSFLPRGWLNTRPLTPMVQMGFRLERPPK